jgi:hypothetical protein
MWNGRNVTPQHHKNNAFGESEPVYYIKIKQAQLRKHKERENMRIHDQKYSKVTLSTTRRRFNPLTLLNHLMKSSANAENDLGEQ